MNFKKIINRMSEWAKSLSFMLGSLRTKGNNIDQVINQLKMLEIIEINFGHKMSYINKMPKDAKGIAFPWLTYPAIEFLRSLDLSNKTVFEYGSGIGSVYWASKAKKLTAVESDNDWFKKVKDFGNRRTTFIFGKSKNEYVSAIKGENIKYDIVIVDGVYRKSCANIAAKYLKKDGFIILDNSEWYPETCQQLRKLGFKQIDFCGFGPVVYFTWKTSIFLKSVNGLKYKTKNYQPVGCFSQTIKPE